MHWTLGRALVLAIIVGWLVGCASGPASRAGPDALRGEAAAARQQRRAEDPALGALVQRTYGEARVAAQTAAPAAGFDRVAFDRTLTRGDIQLAETHLQAFGFDPGPVDGRFTAQTEAAVRAFQRRYGLAVSGLLDHATREELVPGLNPVPKH
jgi:peptidoglycan hydrolase-like protein with peptidoglycan-binding domain